MSKYPTRPGYFAAKYCRLLTKSAAAMEIGPEVCWMLTIIVHQEDSARYKKPINYWNEQLQALCGFGSRKRLVTARNKAIEAGWLHYEPGSKRKPGIYWVTLPTGLSIGDSGSCDESDLLIDGGTKRNGKTAMGGQNGTANDTDSLSGGNETERQRGAMRNGKSAPSIPNPKPNPSKCIKRFDDFWKVVHQKVGKGAARKAYPKAVTAIAKDKTLSNAEAEQWLIDTMLTFAKSPQASDEVKGTIHPATWLNGERYDDDPKIWHNQDAASKPKSQYENLG